MLANDSNTIGNDEINDAADRLVDSAVYRAAEKIPSDERMFEIRAACQREVNELVLAVRRHVRAITMPEARPTLSPTELAQHWGIKVDKVLNWISSGQLKAVNVASSLSGRPRYRIDAQAIAAFKAVRTPQAPEPRRRRRAQPDDNVPEYV